MQQLFDRLSASVLPTVLVVTTLLLIGVLMMMNLWNQELLRYDLYHQSEQARIDIESAFLLYCQDSSFSARLAEDSTFLLFEERESSRLNFHRKQWGLYELVHMKIANGREKSLRLLGKRQESRLETTLYVPENKYSFSLSGKTFIEGELYLPRNGLSYTQVRSDFFTGCKVEESRIQISKEDFPERESDWKPTTLLAECVVGNVPMDLSLKRSFIESPLRIEVPEYLSGVDLSGPIVLFSSGDLFIEQDCRFENIIICARKVEIADGFVGSIQIFAQDTILLGERVCLKSGSGLFIEKREGECLVKLGNHCEVNGYVVVLGMGVPDDERKSAVYDQPETSKVRGLVFIDGVAEVHGWITGSLYVRGCYYFAQEGYYSNLLYNVVLPGNPGVAFPLFMQGAYERKEVKWLD